MDQAPLIGSSINEIYSEIAREFGHGIERQDLIIKMEQILDRCLEFSPQLNQNQIEKIYEILHWSILEQKSCKIQSLVAKAYKIISLHFPTKDWKEIVPEQFNTGIAKTDLFDLNQRFLLEDKITRGKLAECIAFGRWDILLLLYYTGVGIDKENFIQTIEKTFENCKFNTSSEVLDCLKKFFSCIEFDQIWKNLFSRLIGILKENAFEAFIKEFPWQKFPYTVCTMPYDEGIQICLEKRIPWGSMPTQDLHWYSRLKVYYFKKNEKLQQPSVIDEKDWKIGKRIDCRKMITHIGHMPGACEYSLLKTEKYYQDYEWYFVNRHMYRALKRGFLDYLGDEFTFDDLTKQFFDNSLENSMDKLFVSINSGEPCSFETGYAKPSGHSIEIFVFYPYVVICDSFPSGEYALKVYHMNKKNLSLDMLEKLKEKGSRTREDIKQLLEQFIKTLECRPHDQLCKLIEEMTLLRKKQIINNCTWMSKELSFFFFLYLKMFNEMASEEQWTKGLSISEEKLKKFSKRISERLFPAFYSTLSNAFLKFVDKEVASIENKEDSLEPDWKFMLQTILQKNLFVRIEENKHLFNQRLQKIVKLMPLEILSKMFSLMDVQAQKIVLSCISLKDHLENLKEMTNDQDLLLLIQQRILELL